MTGTALASRKTLDLTRAPTEQWNEEMMQLVAATVLKRASTRGEQVYCLAVADALSLNPFIEEIYFLPTKSKDGSGPGIKPYIGRNGLVKKADDAGCYYEAETVREHDKFRIIRKADGTRTCTHSYGHTRDRGEIVGAYAFLHDVDGRRQPAFFYAELSQYLPTFDADWKMDASPWGNQRSAMIEKCAMIGAGRKRLQLGNVLMDGEIARFEQMQAVGPGGVPEAEAGPEFDFVSLTEDPVLADRLRVVTAAAGWPVAKAEMVLKGLGDEDLAALADRLEAEATERGAQEAPSVPEGQGGPGAPEPTGVVAEDVTEADVLSAEDERRLDGLRSQEADLQAALDDADPSSAEYERWSGELGHVQQAIKALENPDQGALL